MAISDVLKSASNILTSGRRVNNGQMHTILENIANADSSAATTNSEPYRRKIAVFSPVLPDRDAAPVGRVVRDRSDFRMRYEPGSAAANAAGYVQLPNVNTTVEYANLQTLTRAYELNLNAADSIDQLSKATVDLLK